MAEVDVDRIKAQVAAARAARPRETLLSGIGRWEILSNKHAAAFLETPPTPLKPSPEAAQAHARRLAQPAKVRRGQVEAARAEAERDDRALPLVPPAEIVQPAFIWPHPVGILVQDNLAPDDNWAQVFFKATGDLGWNGVGFFYIWTNPTQDAIGLSVDTLMGFVGFCSVEAKRSITGCFAHLTVFGGLEFYAGESDVLSPATEVVSVDADAFPLWLDRDYKAADIDALINLSYDLGSELVVPGGGTIVVEAYASFFYTNHVGPGEEVCDFAGPHSRVTSPNMTFTPKPIIIT